MSEKRAFTTHEAAKYLGVPYSALAIARCNSPEAERRSFIPPRHIVAEGGRVLYLREDLDAWLDERATNYPRTRRRREVVNGQV